MCAPSLRRKIYCGVCCIVTIVFCLYFFPFIMSIIDLMVLLGETASGN